MPSWVFYIPIHDRDSSLFGWVTARGLGTYDKRLNGVSVYHSGRVIIERKIKIYSKYRINHEKHMPGHFNWGYSSYWACR